MEEAVTGIALIDSNVRTKIYPLGLMKISAWQKDLGNSVRLFGYKDMPEYGFDEYWVTTTFTYDIPKVLNKLEKIKFMNPDSKIIVGGVSATLMSDVFERNGYQVHKGLLKKAEKYTPDYSILKEKPKYSIAHTTRGCIRKCNFCMVRIVEPNFIVRKDWAKYLHPGARKIQFFDNNWLAKPVDLIKEDVKIIDRLIENDQISAIDFNQALDCRLLTDEIANIIAHLPMQPWRFSFDGMHEDGPLQDAINKISDIRKNKDWGYYNFVVNVLFNYKDSPEDFYYRMHELARLTDRNYTAKSSGFPMKYQPIMDINSRDFVGDKWTKKFVNNYANVIRRFSFNFGICSPVKQNIESGGYTAVELFEFFYGRDKNEFIKLLNMDRNQLQGLMIAKREYQKKNKYEKNFMNNWYNNESGKYV